MLQCWLLLLVLTCLAEASLDLLQRLVVLVVVLLLVLVCCVHCMLD